MILQGFVASCICDRGPAMAHKLVYAHLALFPQGGNA